MDIKRIRELVQTKYNEDQVRSYVGNIQYLSKIVFEKTEKYLSDFSEFMGCEVDVSSTRDFSLAATTIFIEVFEHLNEGTDNSKDEYITPRLNLLVNLMHKDDAEDNLENCQVSCYKHILSESNGFANN